MARSLRGDVIDRVGHGARGEHRLEAHQGDMRGDEKDSRGKSDANRSLEMMTLTA